MKTHREPFRDLCAQLRAVRDYSHPKKGMFVSSYGVAIINREEGCFITTDARLAEKYALAKTITDELMAELLGYPEPKNINSQFVVQAKDQEGNVVTEAISSPTNLELTMDTLRGHGDVSVTSPLHALLRRSMENS